MDSVTVDIRELTRTVRVSDTARVEILRLLDRMDAQLNLRELIADLNNAKAASREFADFLSGHRPVERVRGLRVGQLNYRWNTNHRNPLIKQPPRRFAFYQGSF